MTSGASDRRSSAEWIGLGILLATLTAATHNVFPQFSHEDPGRDLYSAWRFMEGELPNRDFHWTYGPLYLVYASALFKILGTSVATAMLGYKLTQVVSCVFLFKTARMFFGPALAFSAAALHYHLGDMGHTFNHGIVAALISIWLWLLAKEGRSATPLSRRSFLLFLAVLMGLFQSKPNYGIACTAATGLFVILHHFRAPGPRFPWGRLALLGGVWPVLAAAPYIYCLLGQPADRWALSHSFGRGKVYLPFPFAWNQLWITPTEIFSNPAWALHPYAFLQFLLGLGGILTLSWASWSGILWLADRRQPLPVVPLISPVILAILAHEFIMGTFNPASLGYHASGLFALVLAGFVRLVVPDVPRRAPVSLRQAVSLSLALVWSGLAAKDAVRMRWGGTGQFLDHPRARIWYWGGPHPMAKYGRTLIEVAREFESLTEPDDVCAVLPRGSLYFFLAQRRRATWLEEADAVFLTDQPQEEARMIRELASPPVEWILFSNYARYLSSCTPNNNFGEHYARDILKHVRAHYEEVSRVPRGRLHVYQDGEPFRNELHQIQFLRRRPPGAPPADLVLPVTAR